MTNQKIPKYFKEYLDGRFDRLETDFKEIKKGLDENGECLHKINTTMTVYKFRFKWMSIVVAALFLLVLIGFATGLEFFSKGIFGLL